MTNYKRINNIINNTNGTFVGLTTKDYAGTVKINSVSNNYLTYKQVNHPAYQPPVKIHKNSILQLKGFGLEYYRKYANYRFQ